MAHQVLWTKIIVEEFISLAFLTEEEEAVMRTRAAGHTITEQSIELNMCKRKIDYIIAKLKKKYDAVQPYSVLLPPRKTSQEELYMDNN